MRTGHLSLSLSLSLARSRSAKASHDVSIEGKSISMNFHRKKKQEEDLRQVSGRPCPKSFFPGIRAVDISRKSCRHAGLAAEIDVPLSTTFPAQGKAGRPRAREARLNWLGTVLDSPDYSYRAAMPRARAPFPHPTDAPFVSLARSLPLPSHAYTRTSGACTTYEARARALRETQASL